MVEQFGISIDMSQVREHCNATRSDDYSRMLLRKSAEEITREHEKELSMIIPQLLLTSGIVAKDASRILDAGCTHILNCASSYCFTLPGFAALNLPLNDDSHQCISSVFPMAISFIEEAIRGGGVVLVHCVKGVSRSATIVCAYLIWRFHYSYADALAFVRRSRESASPNANFTAQTLAWAQRIAEPLPVAMIRHIVPLSAYTPTVWVPSISRRSTRSSALNLFSDRISIIVTPMAQILFLGRFVSDSMITHATAQAHLLTEVESYPALSHIQLRETDLLQYHGRAVAELPDAWFETLPRLGIPLHTQIRTAGDRVQFLGHDSDLAYLKDWGRAREFGELRVQTPPPTMPGFSPPRWLLVEFPRHADSPQ
ncbi:Dual specificity phosphatase, catalytic domain [Carpediemonas membranifera]|uniref:Dual specificity phosphatase, catalytic domain n=1 Tax=Carpediemonas membranifera TaxID=201153 RepID=A0A8J6AWM8_9EUKA|nr:Dual specificity phosphatase, catalytic domain [Carpediemonas membranifera]|eukprot:KAG9396706.1 Dual specificity phosphatase, catalytic domain [Carpediemonas membranifera]